MFPFNQSSFPNSLFTWQTQINKESGATLVILMIVCFLSRTAKSNRVEQIPSSEALLHDKRNPATPMQTQAVP